MGDEATATETASESTEATAVDTTVATTTATADKTADAAATATTEAVPARKWGGRFEKPEELEAEHYRNEGELRALRQAPKPAATTSASADPADQLSDNELRDLKEANFLKAADPAVDPAERQKAARQIRLIDDKLTQRTVANARQAERAEGASRKLAQEASTVLKQFERDLVPGNPLNDKAQELFASLVESGLPDNPITRGMAVLSAAQILGKSGTRAEERGTLVKELNKAVKETVAAGAGTATTSTPATTDWMKASKEDFHKRVRQAQGLD